MKKKINSDEEDREDKDDKTIHKNYLDLSLSIIFIPVIHFFVFHSLKFRLIRSPVKIRQRRDDFVNHGGARFSVGYIVDER